MRQANLELALDHLQLPDLPPGQRMRLVEAIEQELGRLWAEQGVPAGVTGERFSLEGAQIEVPAGTPPQAIGVHVARAIYSGMAGTQQAAERPAKGMS
jgi:hypothetical protein